MDEYKIDATMEKVGEIANELVWIAQVLEEAENVGRHYFGGGQLQTPNEGVTAIRNFRLIQETAVETLGMLGDFENHRLLDDSGISLRMLLDDLRQDDSRAKFGPLQAGKINQAVDIIKKAFDRAFRSCGSDLKKLSASIRVARGRDEFKMKTTGPAVEKPATAGKAATTENANVAPVAPVEPVAPVAPVETTKWLMGWHDICEAVDWPYDRRREIGSLNKRLDGPITNGGRGTSPMVCKDKLLEWWDSLEARQQDLQNQLKGRKLSAQDQHRYGKDGIVAPELGGGVKKRRRNNKTRPKADQS